MGIKLNNTGKKKQNRILFKKTLQVQRHAQRNAPVDTGRLRSSITTEEDENGARLLVGVNYAIHQEMGTEFMPAQPFIRPAIRTVFGPNTSIDWNIN